VAADSPATVNDPRLNLLPVTKGTFPDLRPDARVLAMSASAGTARFRCAQCEMPEGSCQCDKYCCLCQTTDNVRICEDGLMYCEPCREACDYKTSD
jgi:hypothetical protein